MLLRALAFSFFLHLLFLFQGPPVALPFLNQAATHKGALSASLVNQVSVPAPSLAPTVGVGGPRARGSLLQKTAPNPPAVFSAFSRSTVAIGTLPDSVRSKPVELDIYAESQALRVFEPKEGAGSLLIGEYRLSLAREARRFKRYPPLARENLWEGRVLLTLHFAANAAWPVVFLEDSSGHAVLDTQAMEMMASAARLVALPDELRGKAFVISLPIHYRLTD